MIVGFFASGFHELEKALRERDAGVRTEVQLYAVDTAECLETYTYELVLEVQGQARLVVESAEELRGTYVGVHEGGKVAVVYAVALPGRLHFVDEGFESEVRGSSEVEVTPNEGNVDIAFAEQCRVHFVSVNRRFHEV